ncbi:hypothetical protein BLNAU_15654 [Blattamonas nauphoetae]|uniref:Uncharacterized protein n=1 Tax=Blattamonas nauphoetae TaxID=2049346 RepID=A0ABQ9XDV1_9EUKA|nr:hypothetical protein BLNAU_15654 [Blattamonas nauphoetae]
MVALPEQGSMRRMTKNQSNSSLPSLRRSKLICLEMICMPATLSKLPPKEDTPLTTRRRTPWTEQCSRRITQNQISSACATPRQMGRISALRDLPKPRSTAVLSKSTKDM